MRLPLPLLVTFIILAALSVIHCVNRYYGTYSVFATGDTIMTTFHAHGGPVAKDRKWHIECLDGEGMIGVTDFVDDFQKFASVWCRFLFPNKPPTNGLYPYYPSCFVRNFTFDFHCYSPKEHEKSISTFITGFWDNDFQWWIFRGVPDNLQPYKCCRTPLGYYIDYAQCYYMPTHDLYGEYYDATNVFLVVCATGHVMTGISKKNDPWSNSAHIEWIQCCRIGVGTPNFHRPHQKSYTYDSYGNYSYPGKPTGQFAAQYQSKNLGTYNFMPRTFVGKEEESDGYKPAPPMGGPMFSEKSTFGENFDSGY